MGIKVTRSSSELHPEGTFLFCVKSMTEERGKYGTQIKWGMESKERREDGERFVMTYWTGVVLSTHPECKLTNLLDKLEVDEEEFEEDTDVAIGKIFAGKVEHSEDGAYSNIVKVFHKDKLKAKAKDTAPITEDAEYEEYLSEKAKAKGKGKAKAEFNDPFEDE